MEQNIMVEKMMKKDQIIHPIGSLYAESNAVCYLELILWHKYKTRKKGKCKHSPIDQAP